MLCLTACIVRLARLAAEFAKAVWTDWCLRASRAD